MPLESLLLPAPFIGDTAIAKIATAGLVWFLLYHYY